MYVPPGVGVLSTERLLLQARTQTEIERLLLQAFKQKRPQKGPRPRILKFEGAPMP